MNLANNPRYQALHAARERILQSAAKRIPAAAMASQARALRLWNGRELWVRNEPQMSLLFALAVFDPVGDHTPAIERELKRRADPPGGEAAAICAALPDSAFTLFIVEEEHPQGGVMARDIIRDSRFLLWDAFLSRADMRGCAFAGRLIAIDGAALTLGTTCIVTDDVLQVLEGFPVPDGPPPKFIPPLTPPDAEQRAAIAALMAAPGFIPRLYNASLDLGLFGPRPDR